MSDLRHISVVKDYDQLIAAIRDRVAELKIANATLDRVSGIADGYAGKLLCDPPVKGLGRTSMGPILQTLGLCLIVAEDAEALQKLTPRLDERHNNGPKRGMLSGGEHPAIEFRFSRKRLKRLARRGAKNRNENMTPGQRQRAARRAANVRWRKERRRRKARRRALSAAKRALVPLPALCGSLSLRPGSNDA